MPAVTLSPVPPERWAVLERLWQLYQHDLSEFRGTLPDDDGCYPASRLPAYRDEPDRVGYLVLDGSAPAGFVLVRGLPAGPFTLGEFFVVRAVRRRQLGSAAVHELLRRHPGDWELAFQESNPGAARFWRRLADELAGPGGKAWSEELREVPGRPDLPPDTWLSLTVPPPAPD